MLETFTNLDDARRRIAELETALRMRDQALARHRDELKYIYSSNAWAAVQSIYRLRNRLLPPESARYRLYRHLVSRVLAIPRRLAQATTGTMAVDPCEAITRDQYRDWIERHEPSRRELNRQRRTRWPQTPVVIIHLSPRDRPPELVNATIRSIEAQTYQNYRLAEPKSGTLCREPGDLCLRLSPGDVLAPFALYRIAEALQSEPDLDLIYSDEDTIDAAGNRRDPVFKPDWSPDTLRMRNYLGRLTVYRGRLWHALGDAIYEDSPAAEHELAIRASERSIRVRHLAEILCHRSAGPTSDYDGSFLVDHYRRLGLNVAVTRGAAPGTFRPTVHLDRVPAVSVVIPNRDNPDELTRCLRSVETAQNPRVEVLIVENGSTRAETFAVYREWERRLNLRVLTWSQPFNYASINNYAVEHAAGDLILFLNNDVEAITPDWLTRLVGYTAIPGVGAVGAKLYYPDDTIQHAGIAIGIREMCEHRYLGWPRDHSGYVGNLCYSQNVMAVTAACLLMPASLFRSLGGFDEQFQISANDVDLCLRVWEAGRRVLWASDVELYHYESKTRGHEDSDDKRRRLAGEVRRFRRRWAKTLRGGDPFYSRHFATDRADFRLRR
jgi:GT2 family glycosyltransferase